MQMQFQCQSSTTFFQINKQTKMGERIDSTSTKSQFCNLDLRVLMKIKSSCILLWSLKPAQENYEFLNSIGPLIFSQTQIIYFGPQAHLVEEPYRDRWAPIFLWQSETPSISTQISQQ